MKFCRIELPSNEAMTILVERSMPISDEHKAVLTMIINHGDVLVKTELAKMIFGPQSIAELTELKLVESCDLMDTLNRRVLRTIALTPYAAHMMAAKIADKEVSVSGDPSYVQFWTGIDMEDTFRRVASHRREVSMSTREIIAIEAGEHSRFVGIKVAGIIGTRQTGKHGSEKFTDPMPGDDEGRSMTHKQKREQRRKQRMAG